MKQAEHGKWWIDEYAEMRIVIKQHEEDAKAYTRKIELQKPLTIEEKLLRPATTLLIQKL